MEEIIAKDIPLLYIDKENIDREHICCAIGSDKTNRLRAEQKKKWLMPRLDKGHRFLRADIRGKVFVEYSPAEESVYPVEAPGYAMIQCFWVSGRYQGHGLGSKLYQALEEDCRKQGYKGIVAISSQKKRPYLVDKKVMVHFGFQCCDEAFPWYQLLVKKFDSAAADPLFLDSARRGRLEGAEGLDLFYSPACPFNQDFTGMMADIGRSRRIPVRVHRLDTREQLEHLPVPSGIFAAFLDGEFLSAEIITEKKFQTLLDSKLSNSENRSNGKNT